MFKKSEKVSRGNFNVYTVFDTVSKKYRGTFIASTDEEMIRTSLPSILMDFALRDIEIIRIGHFNDDTGSLVGGEYVHIPTDCYTFPHSRLSCDGDDLSPEEVDKAMKKHKAELVAQVSINKDKKSKEAQK